MFNRIQTIQDVVDWGLCVGCGACSCFCTRGAVSLTNVESIGIRPAFRKEICASCGDCLSICPGIFIQSTGHGLPDRNGSNPLYGPAMETWEGHATDPQLRYAASSGGALSALALYCLEREGMEFVVHTGMDPSKPWMNQTVASRNRSELLARAGSRYAPSSPCEGLEWVEASEGSNVFIGKPCDAAAVSMIRSKRPRLDAGLGLVLSFFCAGTPSTRGTLDLLGQLEIQPGTVHQLRYRGDGWPGCFRVRYGRKPMEKSVSYQESWDFLQRRRPFRCHLCPDGMGELADISCGDAWHTYSGGEDDGNSLILVRSERGRKILRRAMAAGYLVLKQSKPGDVIAAQQGLIQRRQHLFGRLLAMRMMMIPVPRFPGFHLFEAWTSLPPVTKVRTVAGTVKRIMARRLWCSNPL